MKIKIDWMEVKTAASGNKYAKATVTPEGGQAMENVAIFSTFPGFAELMAGHTVEADLTEKEYNGTKSFSLNAPKVGGARPNMERVMEKKASMIATAQDTKAQNIEAAQDRTAWMWAKNNATELLTGTFPQGYSKDAMVADVAEMATDIYNLKPLRPF